MGGDGLVTAADADGAGVVFALADIDVAGVGFGRDGVASEAVGRGGRDVAASMSISPFWLSRVRVLKVWAGSTVMSPLSAARVRVLSSARPLGIVSVSSAS